MKKIIFFLSTLICLSCTQAENDLYLRFQEHIDKEEYGKAAYVLERWDKQYPESADLCLAYVQLLQATKNLDAETLFQSAEMLERGIEKNEYRLDLRLDRARLLCRVGRTEEYLAEVCAILSRIKADSNPWKQAFNEPFNNALNSIESLVLDGYKFLTDNGHFCEARQLVDSSLSHFPNNADLCLTHVLLLEKDAKQESDALSQCVRILARGIEKDECRLDLRLEKTRLLWTIGETEKFLSEVHAILNKSSDNSNKWRQAFNEPFDNPLNSIETLVLDGYKGLIDNGQYYEAGEIVGWSRYCFPNHTGYFIENAEYELESGHYIPAIVHFSNLNEEEYDSLKALGKVALAEYKVGFHELAKKHFKELVSFGSERDKAAAMFFVEKIDNLSELEAEDILVSLLMNVPSGCMSNNAEMSELYNETLFTWLTRMPDIFVEAMGKVNSEPNKVIYNRVLEELSNPINDGIDIKSIVRNLRSDQRQTVEKSDIIQALIKNEIGEL